MTKFHKLIENARNILVITSQPLDPDCISSGLITKKYLQSLGKNVTFRFPKEMTPEKLKDFAYLPYFDEFDTGDTRELINNTEYDALVLLDGSNLVQFYDYQNEELEPPTLNLDKPTILVDHHVSDIDKIYNYKVKNSSASSTIEILLTEVIPIDFLDEGLATLAYAGLVGDTGNFRWNFNANTLSVASKLLEKGADSTRILHEAFFTKSREYYEMLAYAINNLEDDEETGSQFLKLSKDKCLEDGITKDKYAVLKQAFYEELARKIEGYPRSFILCEVEDRKIKIGCRGNSLTNKISLPKLFSKLGGNGGGHFNAAGCDLEGDFDEVVERLREEILKY